MDMNFETLYPCHDLLIALGQVEMALDSLDQRHDSERGSLQPQLESRMSTLLEALRQLAV
jgi:hypothetical protein